MLLKGPAGGAFLMSEAPLEGIYLEINYVGPPSKGHWEPCLQGYLAHKKSFMPFRFFELPT